MTVPLSRDILEEDSAFLMREATGKEISQTVSQINPLKPLVPDGMHAIFIRNVDT